MQWHRAVRAGRKGSTIPREISRLRFEVALGNLNFEIRQTIARRQKRFLPGVLQQIKRARSR